jgi:hypothetical protein
MFTFVEQNHKLIHLLFQKILAADEPAITRKRVFMAGNMKRNGKRQFSIKELKQFSGFYQISFQNRMKFSEKRLFLMRINYNPGVVDGVFWLPVNKTLLRS